MVSSDATFVNDQIRRSFSASPSDRFPSCTRLSRTWSTNSLASGEATTILRSWDVVHNTPLASKFTKQEDSTMELPVKDGRAKFDASAVRKINKTYKKVSSGLQQKESFLQKLLTRKATRRLSRTTRFGRIGNSTRFDVESVSSTEEEQHVFSTLAKPNTTRIIRSLSPFIPKRLRCSIAQMYSRTSDGVRVLTNLFEPEMTVVRGGVMVVDVSGFTRLTEQLGKQGNAGIEMLTLVINNYLSKAIEIVDAYGGDVIKFAGDSLIVAFYTEEDLCTREKFKNVILRSLQCAEDLSRNLGRVQISKNGDIHTRNKTPNTSKLRGTFAWMQETRTGLRRTPSDKKCVELHHNNVQNTKKSPTAPPVATVVIKEPESELITDTRDATETPTQSSLTVQNSPFAFFAALLGVILKRKQQQTPGEEQIDADLKGECAGSSRLTPGTPDKSDRVLHRGSTFWRDSLTSKRSSATSVFRNVLEEDDMSLKVLVGCGDYCMFRVGGVADKGSSSGARQNTHWEYIIADKPNEDIVELFGFPFRQPLTQIAAIESFAKEGDVIVSREILQIADQGFEYETLDGAARITGEMFRAKSKLQTKETCSLLPSIPSKQRKRCIEVLRTHVPASIRPKIEAGHLEYISEIRSLSVLFFGFPGLTTPDASKAQSPLTHVQTTMETLQCWMKEFEGSFVQLRCDEKGFLAICAFGLSGSNHANNSSRAIAAAFKIIGNLEEIGIESCVGITSGDLLCACIGSKTRAEYTLFGNAVNLSARLMCKAKKGLGTILCDASTQQKANRKAHYQPVEEVNIKGLESPVLIYLVTPLRHRRHRHTSESGGSMISLVGRQMILDGLVKRGKQVLEGESGGAVVIQGEAGIGKTKLITEFQISLFKEVSSSLQSVFYTSGDADSKSLPLYSWRRIFESMFSFDREHSSSYETHSCSTLLGDALALSITNYNGVWRGFLAAALEIELEDMPCYDTSPSSTTDSELWNFNPCFDSLTKRTPSQTQYSEAHSSGPMSTHRSTRRRRSTFELNTLHRRQVILNYLLLICKSFIELYGPMILLLENVHHMDTLSWELMNSVVEGIDQGLLVVVTIRPHEGCLAPETLRIKGKKAVYEKCNFEFEKLCKFPQTEVIQLKPFDEETTKELIQIVVEGSLVSDSVVQYIYSKTNGIPLYVEQMTRYLKEQQLLESVILGGALNSNEGLMSFIREQITIHQMLLDKIDELRPVTHLTLKVASVIGKNITVELLEAVYPFTIDRKSIKRSLSELVETGFLQEDKENAIWVFRSMLDRDSVNEFVPQSQRRLLHAKVAAVLSSETYAKAIKIPSTTIAYHWSQSCVNCEILEKEKVLKAVEWWQRSANEAYEKLAFIEALRLYQKAMDYANFLDNSHGQSKNRHKSGALHWIRTRKAARGFRNKKIYDSQTIQVTPRLKATWERRMAQLCVTIAPQASSPELKISVLEEAAFHAIEALQYLGLPAPQDIKMHTRHPIHRIYAHIKRIVFQYNANGLDSKRRDEVSQLLDALNESGPIYDAYIQAIKKLTFLDSDDT
eukprot:g6182.t1